MLAHVARRVNSIHRYSGVRGVWFAVLGEICYRRLAIRECLLDQPFPETAADIPLAIELLGHDQVDEYNAFRHPADPDSARRRLAAGDMCFVARHDGGIVSARWAATSRARCDYLSRTIRLAEDEVYLYDAFTLPASRGKRVFPALTSAMHRYFRVAGKRRAICFTGPENKPAMAANTGYRRIGTIGYVGIGGIRRHFCHVYRSERGPGG